MTAAILAERVAVQLGDTPVLRDLSLAVQPSELACVIGPSGCGKSTLLRLISGLERGHRGRLAVAGTEVTGPSRAVGFMFQEPRPLPWATVRANIALALPRDRGDARIAELLEQVQLAGVADRLPRELSGGMAQRVALARALAGEPAVLLLDEPFSAVDALTRMTLQDLLLDVWQRTRVTILLVTHDLDEAIYLGDRVVVLAASGTARAELAIPLPRPRSRRDPALAALRPALLDALQGASA
jgi:sulfonate transport system ATP-binding protein